MRHIEKTVFISYRRTNAPWALAIFQSLTSKGYDVFFDFQGIASGDFESVIIENIKARAHFIVLLTPSALERCGEPGDWLRREIETALAAQRNLVPLMLDNFHFDAPAIADQLTGKLAALKRYNALRVPTEYFLEAMTRLCEKHLNVPLDAVLHPASSFAQQAAKEQQTAASAVPEVLPKKLADTQLQGLPITAKDPPGSVHEFLGNVTGTVASVIETPQPKPPAAGDAVALPDPAYSPATAAPADKKGVVAIFSLIIGIVIVMMVFFTVMSSEKTVTSAPLPVPELTSEPQLPAANFEAGLQAYEAKDYVTALTHFRPLSDQGNAVAQFYLGRMYDNGEGGLPQDPTKAAELYRKAADQGNADGQFHLGISYEYGAGLPMDFTKAVEWYRKAAAQGNADGQAKLGLLYAIGEGVESKESNWPEAIKLFKQAAEQGHSTGQINLGSTYQFGRDGRKDPAKAVEWYRKAAEQGDAEGQIRLGVMYEHGQGVEHNLPEAVKWYRLAAKQGHEKAQESLKRLGGAS